MADSTKSLSLNFNAKIQPIEKLNEQFTLCKCYVMALGKNRNFSYFSKENVEKNIDSLNYIPVVGHLIENEDGTYRMGSHDMEISIDDNNLIIKSLTVPYGVVINDSYNFEDITEKDGSTATYLTANIILWTFRYPELQEAIYSDDIYFGQSMEINYSGCQPLDEDKNYTNITDFIFSALCLLNKSDNPDLHVEPCFPSARVEPYNNNFNQSEFTKVMGEMKQELSFYFNKNEKDDKKGGINILNEELRNTILQEFNLTLNDINFEITDEMSEEDLRNKLVEFTKQEPSGDLKHDTLFSATMNQKREALRNALYDEIVRDSEGNVVEETYYWVADFDDTYVYVEKDHWILDGDFESTNGRFTYSFNDETLSATISGTFEEMVLVWLTVDENTKLQEERSSFEAIRTEFENYKKNYSTPNADVDELIVFKNNTLEAQRISDETELFEKFEEELSSIEGYSELKENSKDYSIEQLSDKLYALLGKKNATFSVKKKDEGIPRVPIASGKEDEISDEYGGLLTKVYGK